MYSDCTEVSFPAISLGEKADIRSRTFTRRMLGVDSEARGRFRWLGEGLLKEGESGWDKVMVMKMLTLSIEKHCIPY